MRRHVSALSCFVLSFTSLAAQQPEPPAAQPLPPVRVHGRLVTADGSPVVGAALRYGRLTEATTAAVLQQPQTVTDAAGRYELQLSPPRPPQPGSEEGAQVEPEAPSLLLVAAKGFAAVAVTVPWQLRNQEAQVPAFLLAIEGAAGVVYAEATEVEDLVLTPGRRLVSRVRDEAGKPLAGVRVFARDLLRESQLFGGDASSALFACDAVSDAAGIVDLPCVLPNGGELTFQLDGYHMQRIAPVSTATPVEVSMRKGGRIQGRVLDKEGHSIAGARVVIGYERQSGMESQPPLPTGADGSFRTNLDHPGRWRATVWRQQDGGNIQGHSAVLTGSRENLEILIEVGEKEKEKVAPLPVRVVAKGTGKPVARFRVAAAWHEYANQNPGYREYLLGNGLQTAKVASDGEGSVRAPGQHEIASGWLRVFAPGFAPLTQQVEWKEPTAGQAPEAIAVELEAEAVVRGVLRDEASGKPVAGVQVVARVHQDPSLGFYGHELMSVLAVATSGADGAYELRGLGAGHWDLRAIGGKRPRCPLVDVELTAGEQRAGVDMTLPSGAVVAGKLVGAAADRAVRALLVRVPPQAFGGVMTSFGNHGEEQPLLVPIGKDGTFHCEGVGIDNWHLVLRVPSPPRLGGDLYLPIEPFRVRPGGVQREFDCSLDRPGTIRGRLTFAAVEVPFDQLVVVARGVSDDGQGFFSPFDMQLPGPRSFVSPTGEYELHVGPGSYRLAVVDLGTMLLLHDEAKKVDVKSGGAGTVDLQPELARIEIELKGPADGKPMADVERVEVRVLSKAMKALGAKFDGNDDYDRGLGIRWPVGQAVHSVVLPLGDATFQCRNTVQAIRIDDNRWNNAPLGRAEMEIARGNGAKTRCVIEIGTPPEVVDPEAKKDGDAAVVEEVLIK